MKKLFVHVHLILFVNCHSACKLSKYVINIYSDIQFTIITLTSCAKVK